MKRYDEYKDSGIEWIGEIPSHWEVIPLKFVSSCNDESLPETTPLNTDIEYVEISDVQESNGIVNITNYSFEEAPSRARRITRVGDVIVSTVRTYLKAVAKVENENLIVSTGFAVLRAKNINSSFLAYLALSDNFIQAVISLSKGVSYPAITATDLIQIKVAIPTATEQHCITQYLDRKCASIDKVIATQERRIALLDELKQSIITEAVTRGINPEAALRDSGIEWIGKIPEHWSRRRFKFLFIQHSDGIWGDDEKGDSNDIVCYRVADFDYEKMTINHNNNTLRNIIEKDLKGRIIQNGDLLIEKSGGGETTPVGRVVLASGISYATCSNFIHYTRVTKCVSAKFLCYYFKAMYSNKVNTLYFNQTTGIQNLQIANYLGQDVFLPPNNEQLEIVEYLEKKCGSIDTSIDKAKKEIELLRELKQSIITEAVTGKVKVC